MTVVTDLHDYGYAYIACDYALLQNAISAQRMLVEAEWFSSTKAAFNRRPDAVVRTTNPHIERCLLAINAVYKGLETELHILAEQLFNHHKFKNARVASVTRSFSGIGNETSDLYLTADTFGGQKSLFRLYLCGEGQIDVFEEGGGRVTITPPRGSALVVYGTSAPAFVGVSHLKVARVQALLEKGRGSFLYVQPATEEVVQQRNNVCQLSTHRRILHQQQ